MSIWDGFKDIFGAYNPPEPITPPVTDDTVWREHTTELLQLKDLEVLKIQLKVALEEIEELKKFKAAVAATNRRMARKVAALEHRAGLKND